MTTQDAKTEKPEDLAGVIARLIPEGAVLRMCRIAREWMTPSASDAGSPYAAALVHDAAQVDLVMFQAQPATLALSGPPPTGSIIELMAKRILELESQHAAGNARIEELERERVSITNAVRLVPGAPVDSIVASIKRIRHEISDAKEALAPYCPEADPSRCGLDGIVDLLRGDVLDPLGPEPWLVGQRVADARRDLSARIADLESENATMRDLLERRIPGSTSQPGDTGYQALAESTIDKAMEAARSAGQTCVRESVAVACLAEALALLHGHTGRIADLDEENATLRGILASVPAAEDDL